MSKRNTAITWIVVILVIIGGMLLAVLWPSLTAAISGDSSSAEVSGSSGVMLSSATPDTVDVALLVNDLGKMIGLDISLGIEPVNTWVAFVSVAVFTVGSVVVFGLILTLLYRFLDKWVTRTKQDDDYQAAVVELDNREKAFIKEHLESQPPDPIPSHERTRWSVVSTALITIMFFMFGGVALGWNVAQNSAELLLWAAAFGLLGLIVSVILLSPRRMLAVEGKDSAAIPWSSIWVIISGLVIVGLGLGVMVFVVLSG
ncbi:MAG: hypothetical protein M9928_09930 [Anaerolineae bacterium]|nr:hypothetical protein [Anaerolineae bacterium]MCO5187885.1 hypothetical protein [Anaerolineae bacterium]MCO5192643.1 hypothetical protein [Anaerolineae bacterium]MCO5197845.1 hypothetical protein [Anaerolineae bacterium]MCO5205341.1 hypothetical protein [Anaerolineae bacterium]